MSAYIIRRLLFMVPTLLGIMLVSFIVVQFAPGGPVERVIAQLTGSDNGSRIPGSGTGGDFGGRGAQGGSGIDASSSKYRGAQGLDPEFIKKLEKQFGFDKPAYERFFLMLKNFIVFDFGKSYFRDVSVMQLIKEKLPVSMSLGIWMTLLTYLISIPLGIRKAVSDGSRFDTWTSGVIIIGYAIPGFLIAIFLIILFAGGSYWDVFPLRGLTSDNWSQFPWWQKILDYFWHLTLPIIAMMLSAFATMTLLTKNSFLDEIKKQYVLTARANGCTPRQVLYGHIFRNAMLIVIAGFPSAFVHAFFSGSLLIETIFSLDGLGLLGFESVLNRDYPVVFATLYIFALIGLVVNLISDLTYTWIDARIDPGISQIGDQVHHHADQREDEERGEHHRIIAVEHAFEAEQAEAVEREDRFDQQRSGEKGMHESRGKSGDHDQHGVAEDVTVQHLVAGAALGAGGEHVLLADFLQE